MKISKTIKDEVLQVYETWLHSYLNGDVVTYNSYFDNDYHFIGSTSNEEFLNRKDTTNFFEHTAEQLAGKCDLRNEKRTLEQFGELIFITHFFDAWFLNEEHYNYYERFRFSSVLRKNGESWRFIYQHFSTPDSNTDEGETIGFDKISEENNELRDAIKRRTAELESKNRELQIEAALERVRAVAMGMNKPEDMLVVCREISGQLQLFGVDRIRNVQTAIIDAEIGQYLCYQYFTPYGKDVVEKTEYLKSPVEHEMVKQMLASQDAYFTNSLSGNELDAFRTHRKKENFFPDPFLDEATEVGYCFLSIGEGGLGLSLYTVLNEEILNLFKRFHQVFSLAYQRFRDIQKAEAQAREAQIETALEKVRSRTMAMQHSDELQEASYLLDQQVRSLGIQTWGCAFNIYGEEDSTEWFGNEAGVLHTYTVPREGVFKEYYQKHLEGETFYVKEFAGQNCIDHYEFMSGLPVIGDVLLKLKETNDGFPTYQIDHVAYFKYGYVLFITRESVPESHGVFKRFAKVFEQTYTRFLDLQNAEAQAREAQIEVALERVRSKAMAMHNSDDLAQTVDVFFHEIKSLNVSPRRCGVTLINKESTLANVALTSATDNGEDVKLIGQLDLSGHLVFDEVYRHWQIQEEYHPILKGEELRDYYQFMNPQLEYPIFPDDNVQFGHYFYFEEGVVFAWTDQELSNENLEIFRKFKSVLSLTYRRFLDLQKAEDQAREAKIQLALERVRARIMAMHESDELSDAAAEMFQQMADLSVTPERLNICFFNEEERTLEVWPTDEDGLATNKKFTASLDEPTTIFKAFTAWKEKKNSTIIDLHGKELKEWVAYVREAMGLTIKEETLNDRRIHSMAFFSHGLLMTTTSQPIPVKSLQLLERFTQVFDQAYIRFLDLQKAESQAREAQVELSLERIRAQVTSMKESTDLFDIVVGMRKEFIALGHESDYFWHMRWLPEVYEMSMTSEDGNRLGMVIQVPKIVHDQIDALAEWEKSEYPIFVLPLDAKDAWDYLENMNTYGHYEKADPNAPAQEDIEHIGGLTFIIARTTHGEIGYSLPGMVPNPPKEALDTLMRFAGVFDLAYKRFEDLKTAEKDLIEIKRARQKAEDALIELKATQSQLIQAEKMASLGELTAGIAHEIQNPLNFVNNFSEVSAELLVEMAEEMTNGDLEEAAALATDIKDNLEKITHHGKRADAIVKGMLTHSRSGKGEKTPTDLNALAEEYLKLSYHGLRAKDKSFNADFKTDFDPSLPKMNVVPQDIGRVLLNLINNAFQACASEENEKPLVTVRTARSVSPSGLPAGQAGAGGSAEGIQITITDNGPGIPPDIKEKIFQPFFTTKPTGEGTGLGLSLSYDIVKAHGGELTVESSEKTGSTFTIEIPSKN